MYIYIYIIYIYIYIYILFSEQSICTDTRKCPTTTSVEIILSKILNHHINCWSQRYALSCARILITT